MRPPEATPGADTSMCAPASASSRVQLRISMASPPGRLDTATASDTSCRSAPASSSYNEKEGGRVCVREVAG